jgi:acetolactate synthase-1/2/3 large subunit
MVEITKGSPFDNADFRRDDAPHLAPHRAVHDLETAAGETATFVSDIGEHMLFGLHYLTALGPRSFVVHLGLGSMGSGVSSAIGHALGNPHRRVVCICGDGSMQVAGSELLVALKHRLPIVYAVFNDARYNMVYHGYRQQFGAEAPWDTPWVDFVAWAGSMGIPGARIEHPGEITAELLDRLTADGRPAVLDIRHDPAVRIRGAGRVESLKQMASAPPPARNPQSIPVPRTLPPPSSRAPVAMRGQQMRRPPQRPASAPPEGRSLGWRDWEDDDR